MHCVMRLLIVLLLNMLSGLVRFLVHVAHRVGMSLGSNITIMYSAKKSSRICKAARLLAVNR